MRALMASAERKLTRGRTPRFAQVWDPRLSGLVAAAHAEMVAGFLDRGGVYLFDSGSTWADGPCRW